MMTKNTYEHGGWHSVRLYRLEGNTALLIIDWAIRSGFFGMRSVVGPV